MGITGYERLTLKETDDQELWKDTWRGIVARRPVQKSTSCRNKTIITAPALHNAK
jgi:hypothetical protein